MPLNDDGCERKLLVGSYPYSLFHHLFEAWTRETKTQQSQTVFSQQVLCPDLS